MRYFSLKCFVCWIVWLTSRYWLDAKSSLAGCMVARMGSGMPVADRMEIVDAERAREAIEEGVTVLDVT